jgi:hypothetical protein
MTRDEFIEALVKIEWVDNSNCFGLFPFQMYVEFSDSTCELHSIAITHAGQCYMLFIEKILFIDGVSKVFMALDFPATGDITHDFVAVFTGDKSEDTVINVMAIPYTDKGLMLEPIMLGESETLARLYKEMYIVFNRKVKG